MSKEILMPLRPKTDKDLLIWEKAKSKELEVELAALKFKHGETQSELDELKHRMKKEQLSSLILKNNKLKKQGHKKDEKIRELKKKIDELTINLVRLQTTGSINKKIEKETSENSTTSSPANL